METRPLVGRPDLKRPMPVEGRDPSLGECTVCARYQLDALAPASQRVEWEKDMQSWRLATEFPYFGQAFPGFDGTLWNDEQCVLVEDPRRFLTFDADGRALAHVDLPAGGVPLQVSRDEMLAMREGGVGVPQIGLWRLRR